jgi:hypothetical protein
MAADMPPARPPGKDEQTRRFFGSRPIGALVPALTRPAFRKHSPAAAQMMADWPTIVGPALAATTAPRRFAAGTLTLGCAGPVALELQHLAGPLMERINGHLGRPLVQRLKFVQYAVNAEQIPLLARQRARQVDIPDFPEGSLRDALAALGGRLPPDPA